MKIKNVLIIVLTVLVFLSGAVLGVSAVYRIDEVRVEAYTISEDAKTEKLQLQQQLLAAYEKQSTFLADDTAARAVLEDFPYFRLLTFKRSYPNRIVVEVTEDAEVYAVACDGEQSAYYILNAEGTVLGIREDYANRSDETGLGKNVLLSGVTVFGEKGKPLSGNGSLSYLFTFCKRADELLQGIRRNIISVEVRRGGSSEETVMLKLTTCEGVNIYVNNPSQNAIEKAEKAINAYMGLGVGQRTRGMLTVTEVNGEIRAVYSDKDILDG